MNTRSASGAGLAGLWILLLLATSPVAAATFTVTNTNDGGVGSLRWAITSANATPGWDVIDFNIPGPGPFTIMPLTSYPQLTDPSGVMIDGLTQPGATAGANPPATLQLLIEIDGFQAGAAHGFWIVTPLNTIQGLAIGRFQQDAVRIQATPNATFGNLVSACLIGTDVTGTMMRGNGWNATQLWAGVDIICSPGAPGLAHDNTVELSVISDCYSENVSISNCPPGDVFFNIVHHNYIGTDITGTQDFGASRYGLFIGETAHDNSATDNIISGNNWGGVSVVGNSQIQGNTHSNSFFDNAIGLAADRLTPLPNTGNGIDIGQYGAIREGFARDNLMVLNTIAHNTGTGIAVWEHWMGTTNTDGNRIAENSIYANGNLGIDLGDNGVTPNDPSDPDAGPNQEVNCPVVFTADYNGGTGMTNVTGWLDIDTPPTLAEVQIFKARLDPSGAGEGEVFLGITWPDAAGNWSTLVGGLAIGDDVTATAIDMANNTSEFSTCFVVTPAVGASELAAGPAGLRLDPPRPNPFRLSTEVRFVAAGRSPALLTVHDVAGRRVRTLVRGPIGAGPGAVRWDGTDDRGRRVADGVYLVRLESVGITATRRVVLLR